MFSSRIAGDERLRTFSQLGQLMSQHARAKERAELGERDNRARSSDCHIYQAAPTENACPTTSAATRCP